MASTRRGYLQAFKGFHAFLVARKMIEIEAAFGVRLVDPVDEFNAARHVGADSPSAKAPPGPERMEDFFDFLKVRVAGARKYAVAGRDYALFRVLYLAGCGRRKLRRWTARTCILAAGRLGSFMFDSVRVPTRLGLGRVGCRCSTGWI